MRREIGEARSIHESLFPRQLDDGFVRFEYTYTPYRELGGDYVHLHTSPAGNHAVYVTLLDVTGHGLAAALTVNRLYGELERIFGETPDAAPVEVLSLLNRYIHLTMVKHNIYVTGLCMRLDPVAGRLVWSSAGHPPAFLRGANGVVKKLAATNCLLGALDGQDFQGQEQENELAPGDAILMYTDGAFEARDRHGKSLGLDQINALAQTQPAPRRWPQFIAAAVHKHTAGSRADDDVLVATLTYQSPRPAAELRHPRSEVVARN
jgi:serine phosphatase RsbU (regulator of sigma subunit)